MSKHLSDDRNDVGTKGELAARDWLVQQYGPARVLDATRAQQDVNIDFVVLPEGEPKLYVEAKADRNVEHTGNFAMEMARLKHDLPLNHFFYPSWFIASQANSLIVYGPTRRVLYVMSMPDARRAVNEHVREQRERSRWQPAYTDEQRTSINVLLPIASVPHECWQYDVVLRQWAPISPSLKAS